VTKATVLIVQPDALEGALVAARQVGIPFDRVVPLDTIRGPRSSTVAPDLHRLISYGLAHRPNFVERRLRPGEGKTKVAFLSFSSGTTGKPKVSTIYSGINNELIYFHRQAVEIPHYAPIANIIQMATWWRVNDESVPWEKRRIRQGDTALAGALTRSS
jgi:4-coumarate--CoA ligase